MRSVPRLQRPEYPTLLRLRAGGPKDGGVRGAVVSGADTAAVVSIERSSPGLRITSPREVEGLTLTGVLVGLMLSRTGTTSAAPDVKAGIRVTETWPRIAGGGGCLDTPLFSQRPSSEAS